MTSVDKYSISFHCTYALRTGLTQCGQLSQLVFIFTRMFLLFLVLFRFVSRFVNLALNCACVLIVWCAIVIVVKCKRFSHKLFYFISVCCLFVGCLSLFNLKHHKISGLPLFWFDSRRFVALEKQFSTFEMTIKTLTLPVNTSILIHLISADDRALFTVIRPPADFFWSNCSEMELCVHVISADLKCCVFVSIGSSAICQCWFFFFTLKSFILRQIQILITICKKAEWEKREEEHAMCDTFTWRSTIWAQKNGNIFRTISSERFSFCHDTSWYGDGSDNSH